MDGEHRIPLTDRELDDALAAAVSVEPSGDFKAHVRARISTDTPASPWPWLGGRVVLAGALLAAAITWQVSGGRESSLPLVQPPAPPVIASGVRVPGITADAGLGQAEPRRRPPAAAAVRPPSTPASAVRTAVRGPTDDTAATADTGVLLAESEQEGLRLLFEAIATGRLELPPEALEQGPPLVQIRMIQPRDIDPFSTTASEGAVE